MTECNERLLAGVELKTGKLTVVNGSKADAGADLGITRSVALSFKQNRRAYLYREKSNSSLVGFGRSFIFQFATTTTDKGL